MNKDFEALVNQMTEDELEEAIDFIQQAKETLHDDLYIVTPCGDQLDTTYVDRGTPIAPSVSDGIAEICFS